jgi:hypothetical protein
MCGRVDWKIRDAHSLHNENRGYAARRGQNWFEFGRRRG